MNSDIQIVDVAPRDGFQAVKPLIEVERKAQVVRALADAGLERIETGAFVSPKACLLYTSPSPRDGLLSRMPSSA